MTGKNMIKIYGIKNCDSCKKAIKYISAQTDQYEFIDIRQQAQSATQLTRWCKLFGMKDFINRRSTTWRSLSDHEKSFNQVSQAVALIETHPTLMKRPITTRGAEAVLGFNTHTLDTLIKS